MAPVPRLKLSVPKSTMALVDTAAVVIESIWPQLPGSQECTQKQKGLPLRTFIQETLKRSRSSYSTLQTALFYLYKIRNKVPGAYIKRRHSQLQHTHHMLSASQPAAGLMTPPASPLHLQNIADFSSLQGPDYFSLRSAQDPKHVLPSPLSSTCSMTSASPASSLGYSPCSSSSSPTASSPTSSSSPVSAPAAASSSSSSTSSSSSNQSNRIIYCGRRTFLAALMVASKYLQDRNYSNKAWAKISGLSIKEINANELIFLKLIDYSLFVSHDTFIRWTALLVAHGHEATRRFMQTPDAAYAAAFAARALSTPAMTLNESHIRYSPVKSGPAVLTASPCESEDESADARRVPKVARTNTYPPLQGNTFTGINEGFAF
ncbi:hypothetical protein BGZ70_005630 [Mortierella alpina]|uniref:Uncharacterized protein n=1 Tax=Mortierella alpina TaxID=64518 RepID=A0A9P6M734_MORAP|nr:hypothetical protein BGZ70_005630 [Mortierella alpina]